MSKEEEKPKQHEPNEQYIDFGYDLPDEQYPLSTFLETTDFGSIQEPIDSEVQKITTELRDSTDEETKRKGRIFLRKILLATPHWNDTHKYILEHALDVTYLPEEAQKLQTQIAKQAERNAKAQELIKAGISPWEATARVNERDDLHPYIVGFYQLSDGKIKTLYGQRHFKSNRNHPPGSVTGFLGQGWSPEKKVDLLSTAPFEITNSKLIKGSHWHDVPESLTQNLENPDKPQIIVTGNTNLYELKQIEIEQLAENESADALTKYIDNKIQQQDGYFLLYYSGFRPMDISGRTGVLMEKRDGNIEPVTIPLSKGEAITEIKGCGTQYGAFKTGRSSVGVDIHQRTGRDIVTGTVEAELAEIELREIEKEAQDSGFGSGGIMLFDTEIDPEAGMLNLYDQTVYHQGEIIRYSPGNVRASFAENDAFPDTNQREITEQLISMYADSLVTDIFKDHPKIIELSSHMENLLIRQNGTHQFTDFSDHASFSDSNYPHYVPSWKFLGHKEILFHYLNMFGEINGVKDNDVPLFYQALSQTFMNHGITLNEISQNDMEAFAQTVAQDIWEKVVGYKVYDERKKTHYFPEQILKTIKLWSKNAFDPNPYDPEPKKNTQEIFFEKYNKQRTNGEQVVKTLLALEGMQPNSEILQECLQQLQQHNILGPQDRVMELIDKAKSELELQGESLPDEFVTYEYDAKRWDEVITPYLFYFSHIYSVLNAAEKSCPSERLGEISSDKRNLEDKLTKFKEMSEQPESLFKLLTDEQIIREMLTI